MTALEILGRDVRVEWHEAIALVRDVAERIAEGADPATVPDLHQIELLPRGEIQVHGGSEVSDPAQWFGQMLQLLLSRADPPVQMRLLISQTHDSVQAFSEALAFFERPERAAVLQALYNRSAAALPLPAGDALAVTMTAFVEPAAADKNHTDDPVHPRRKLVYAAALAAVVAVIGAVALYAGRAESASANALHLRAKVSNGISGMTSAVGTAVSAIGGRVGLGGPAAQPAPVEAAAAPAPTTAAAKPDRSPKTPPQKIVPELERATLTAFDLDPQPQPPLIPTETVVIVAQPEGGGGGESAESGEPIVYSSSSKDVSAPVGLRPQLPKEMPAGVRAEDLTRIELVILPDGTVDSVKLLDKPRDIHASMLLSAAKAWQFRPAMKDGLPVRYRKTVWVGR